MGEGIAKHFMVPFNEKLWQVSLDELTSDWVSWLVPKPDLKDVINGALGIKDKAFGYNPTFLYPAQGGISVLPRAFLPGVRAIAYGCELIEVETKRRRATFSDGRVEEYDELVVADVKDIRYAYVLFDKHRACALPAILEELARRGIHSIGRYGRWEHTSMEDAMAQGKQLAEQLRAS